MREPKYILRNGIQIVTHAHLGSTSGMMIKQNYLDARKPNQRGEIAGWVAGHGGDVYWVKHEETNDVAAYGWPEFEVTVYVLESGNKVYMVPDTAPKDKKVIHGYWVEDLQAYGDLVEEHKVPTAWDAVASDEGL